MRTIDAANANNQGELGVHANAENAEQLFRENVAEWVGGGNKRTFRVVTWPGNYTSIVE